MRVLVVTPWFPGALSPGSGVFNLRDARLLQRDHEVTVLHLCAPRLLGPDGGGSDDPAVGGPRVVRVPFALERPATVPPAVRRLRELARDADLVHSMAMPALVPTSLARTGLPWVHTEHYSQLVTPPASARAAASLAVLKRCLRRPTEVVAVSSALAGVIDRYRATPAAVIGNEVMTPEGPVPERHDLSGRLRLIGVGGILARKGPVEAVETLAELVARGVDAELAWVGDGELRAEMLAAAERSGVSDRLRLAGQLSPERLSRELLEADLFLLPVETETFGVAIAEALAHGLPVVATGTGGHEEFLAPDASRLIVERAPGPLADAVQSLLGDPALPGRAEIAAAAAARFSDEARREAYREVYARATRPRGSRR